MMPALNGAVVEPVRHGRGPDQRQRAPKRGLSSLQPRERIAAMEEVAHAYLKGVPVREFWQEGYCLSFWVVRQLYNRCLEIDGESAPNCKNCPGRKVGHHGMCRPTKHPVRIPKKPKGPPQVLPPHMVETECPCCNSKIGRENLAVDIDTNTVSFNGQAWRLSPQFAVFMYALAKAWPNAVNGYDMRVAIWGAIDGPDHNDEAVKVYASKMRQIFRDTGVEIRRGTRSGGYVLALPDGGCTVCDKSKPT